MANLVNNSNLNMLSRFTFAFATIISSQVALADEGGSPFWVSGQYAAMAAVPTNPGWSISVMPYVYTGGASKSKSLSGGGSANAGVNTKESMLLLQLGYSPEQKIFGGQPYIGFSWGPGSNTTSASASVYASRNVELNRSNSVNGVQDIFPLASLAWTKGNNNFMTYLTGNIPVGTYNYSSLAAIGLGHAAIDSGVGYTYFNTTTGWEFSGVVGATYNWINKQTNYQSGVDSHLDWSISRLLTAKWQAGIAGYVYYQLTPDSGGGDRVGAFKSQISAIGPQIGYLFNINKKPAYINLRAYKEFWAQNRVEGHAVFATINIPLSK